MPGADPTELEHGDWAAWVTIEGSPVPVYKTTTKPELRKTTCYIEATSGKEFQVHFRDDQEVTDTDWAAILKIDGTSMLSTLAPRAWTARQMPTGHPWREIHFLARPSSEYTEQAFVFSAPTLTDDPTLSTADENVIKNLATVQVSLCRGSQGAPTYHQAAAVKETVLHERAKKGMVSHTAKLGAEKPMVAKTYSSFDYIDQPATPFWTFEFKYLSRVLLELGGHVESEDTPEAEPAPAKTGKKRALSLSLSPDDDDDDDDGDEVARLKARLAKLEGERGGEKKIKKEKVKQEKVTFTEKKDKDGKTVLVLDD